jgi:ELWxxDGT repeat protein
MLYFSADDGSSGYELWVSDGTAAGTVRLSDLNPGIPSSLPAGIVSTSATVCRLAFFSATLAVTGRELWALYPNGTACNDGNACTQNDVCTGSVCVGATITAPPETQNLSAEANKITIDWSAAAFATRYDVVRGSLGALPVGPGDGDEICVDDLGGPTVVDTDVLAPGAGFWYLSRGENACGIGTFGTQGVHGAPGAPRVTTTCP